jgi:hypothetical protein
MITYKPLLSFPSIRIPVLHRVVYARTPDGMFMPEPRSARDLQVAAWLEANCCHSYYRSPGYLREKFIEFECDEDAMMFALKWPCETVSQ